MRLNKLILILVISLLLLACGRSKDSQFYVLNPIPPYKEKVHYTPIQIGIDEISIPAYLDKPQLMIYHAINQMSLEEYHQWAESSDKNIKRVIETNLSTLLPGAIVENSPWDIKFKPNFHLQIDISEFTININGNSVLRAKYLIYSEEQLIKKEDVYYYIKLPIVTVDNLVRSMNTNLTHLSEDIARTFSSLKRR